MGKSLRLGAGCVRVYPACTYHISRVYNSCLENILRALFRPDASRARRRRARPTTRLVRRRTLPVVVHRSRDDRENTANARARPHDREREVTTRNVAIDRAIESNRNRSVVRERRRRAKGGERTTRERIRGRGRMSTVDDVEDAVGTEETVRSSRDDARDGGGGVYTRGQGAGRGWTKTTTTNAVDRRIGVLDG